MHQSRRSSVTFQVSALGLLTLVAAMLSLAIPGRAQAAAEPHVTQIEASHGPSTGGTAVTIKGTGFISSATVTIGAAATGVTVVSAEEITATTPAGSGSQEVVVSEEGANSTGGPLYTYVPAPTVSSVTPSEGPTTGGTAVKIKGTGFLSGATVMIGAEAATDVIVVSSEEITARTLAGSGEPEVIVSDEGGSSTGGPKYAYRAAPTVKEVTPNHGSTAGGTLVTITGTGFLAGSTVTIGSAAKEVIVVSATEITAKTSAKAAGN